MLLCACAVVLARVRKGRVRTRKYSKRDFVGFALTCCVKGQRVAQVAVLKLSLLALLIICVIDVDGNFFEEKLSYVVSIHSRDSAEEVLVHQFSLTDLSLVK